MKEFSDNCMSRDMSKEEEAEPIFGHAFLDDSWPVLRLKLFTNKIFSKQNPNAIKFLFFFSNSMFVSSPNVKKIKEVELPLCK